MRVVIPSVNYGDLLAVTLPAWVDLVGREALLVVTDPSDIETLRVAAQHRVNAMPTDAWTRIDPSCHVSARQHRAMKWWRDKRRDAAPSFNLALALDEAFGFPLSLHDRVASGELCAVVDADCYPFGEWPSASEIQPNTIYGCWRYRCESPDVLDDHRHGRLPLSSLKRMRASGRIEQSQHRDVPNVGEGYFQLFRARPGLRFGSYPAADEYDFDFALKFPIGKMFEGLYVLHLGENARNWDGRVTPRWEGVTA